MNSPAVVLLPYVASLLISAGVAFYAWRQRSVPGAAAFAVFATAQAVTVALYMLELVSPTLSTKHFWDDLQWVGFIVGAIAIPIFSRGSGGLHTPRRLVAALTVVPAIFLLLLATQPLHGWVRAQGTLLPGDPFDALVYDFRWGAYAISAYMLALGIWAMVELSAQLLGRSGIFRVQSLIILIGVFVNFFGGIFSIFHIIGTFQRDVNPFAFAIGNLIIAYGFFRYRLFDVVPVAYAQIVNSMPEAIIVLDDQRRVVELNPAAKALFGLTAAAIGQPALEVFAPWQSEIAWLTDVDAVRYQTEGELGGQHRILDVTLTPLRAQSGQPAGRLFVLHDITEEVETQRALEERTRQLERANIELEQARARAEANQHAAEEADRIKSQFLASMSHELRTPLNAVLNFTEIMSLEMLGPLTDEQRDVLGKSLASGHHLLALINDVLDITKMESGLMRLFLEENTDLAAEINQVIEGIKPMLKGKPVALIIDIDSPLPAVTCDRRRIRQVLYNLMSNAAKFTEEGSITLSVKRHAENILFAVMDTGPGIAEADQAMIFEPFEQADTGLRHTGGTGLGLPISRRLVEAHRGRLWVESAPGEGASFFFTIPITLRE